MQAFSVLGLNYCNMNAMYLYDLEAPYHILHYSLYKYDDVINN